MLWELASSDVMAQPQTREDGNQDPCTYILSRGEKIVAMFKPTQKETFVREGVLTGTGAIREEAAYVLDTNAGGLASVPPTAVAHVQVGTNIATTGSVQRFMRSKMGALEDFGMPRLLPDACAFVPIREIQKIALLDLRLFNTDRHLGNLLLGGDTAPFTLVPIDHGCILPSWGHLSEARFDWAFLPQAECPLSSEMHAQVAHWNIQNDAVALRKLGIREECIVTMKIATRFVQIAAENDKSPTWMAHVMLRDGCLTQPSRFEYWVMIACRQCHVPFRFVFNAHQEQVGVTSPGILSRRVPNQFYQEFETLCRAGCQYHV